MQTHNLVGKYLDSVWGYDQTNVDFYVIVKETTKTLWYVPVNTRSTMQDHNYLTLPDTNQGQKLVQQYQADPKSINNVKSSRKSYLTGTVSVKLQHTQQHATLWNGQAKLASPMR